MDPITLIITAIVAGLAAGATSVGESAINDAYSGLKALIQTRFGVSLGNLEKNPDSDVQQAAVEENLKNARAHEVQEVIEKAKVLFAAARKIAPNTTIKVGGGRSKSLTIEEIYSSAGVNIEVTNHDSDGDVRISNVGGNRSNSNPN